MMSLILQYVIYLVILVILAFPLGIYISKIMDGEKVFLTKVIKPIEKGIYKLLHIDETEEMTWKKYLVSVFILSGIGLIILFLLLILQGHLFGNPQHVKGMRWDLSLNTAISFITNTNWQAYSGEHQLSYLTQAIGLTVQNFLSAATGIAVLYALIRGFTRVDKKGIGNFWKDITRVILYILLPLALIESIFLVSQGVVQSGKSAQMVQLSEPIAVSKDGDVIENAQIAGYSVTVNGKVIKDAKVVSKEIVPLGLAASQVAIKQLGTNGGGFYGTNSAHPLENPNWFTNLVEMISILLIPMALCFAFGRSIRNRKQGIAIFAAMFIVMVIALASIAVSEQVSKTVLNENSYITTKIDHQAGGNMEGKESRNGIVSSVTWSTFTVAASNGSVNAMHDSYTPMGGMVIILLIQLGEVIFGGVGCGLYGMLGFAILTVFIAGLMVGRTPEFLGKKIEPFEMKCAVIMCLATPIAILVGSGIAALVPSITNSLTNSGAHGFSEMLYAFSSAGGNNGSAFAGFNGNTVFLNLILGLCMLFARFVPMIGVLSIAGSMVKKRKIATTAGTMSTCNATFVFLLIFVVMLIGALSFFPSLALGPIAEFFG